MAEVDPEALGRSGVDPETGSALSPTVKNALLKKSSINVDAFNRQKREEEQQNISLIQNQQNSFVSFNSSIQSLRSDIGKLGTGLANIALLLQQDGAEEQNKIRADQEKQRRLAEREIRIGKENEIEQKIQNALVKPVEKLVPKVTDIFSQVGNALSILFLGWLTKQTVDAIQASQDNNTKRFNEIKTNIIKNVGIAVGGLFAVKTGFFLIKKTIGSIASGLTKLLIVKPLAGAAGLLGNLSGLGGGAKPPTPGGKSGGGVMGGLGRLLTGLSAAMNARNKEYTDAVLGALSLFAMAPGPIGIIAKVAGVSFTLDEIAEAFGKNIFGDERDNIINDAATAAKKQLEQIKSSSTSSTPPSTSAPPISSKPSETPPSAAPTPSPAKSAPSADMVNKFEMAWQYRNNPMARGRIEGAWNQMTPEQKQQAKDWAQTKGYDWNEMKLNDTTATMTSATEQSKLNEANVSPGQISPPPSPTQTVGTLPEPKPSLTMISTSNNQNQIADVPITNGALSDVPFINSSNPDNFYVLYSQLNYNIVI